MRYALAAIAITVAGLLIWIWQAGKDSDIATMVYAIVCVLFFASMPVVLGIRRTRLRRNTDASSTVIVRDNTSGPAC